MSIDEAINRFEKLASDYEFNLNMHKNHVMNLSVNDIERMQEYLEENRQLAEWLRELKDYKNKDMRLIYANPLGEAIRCAMCTNPIKSDRGCDGGCKVDEQMYKKVMEAVNGLIVEVNADGDSC